MSVLVERPAPRRTILTFTVPPGMSEAERDAYAGQMWALHVIATLLEDRCPRCLGPLLPVEEAPERAAEGWRRCWWISYPDGWWRRNPVGPGVPAGYEWRLGINPHTGEYEW